VLGLNFAGTLKYDKIQEELARAIDDSVLVSEHKTIKGFINHYITLGDEVKNIGPRNSNDTPNRTTIVIHAAQIAMLVIDWIFMVRNAKAKHIGKAAILSYRACIKAFDTPEEVFSQIADQEIMEKFRVYCDEIPTNVHEKEASAILKLLDALHALMKDKPINPDNDKKKKIKLKKDSTATIKKSEKTSRSGSTKSLPDSPSDIRRKSFTQPPTQTSHATPKPTTPTSTITKLSTQFDVCLIHGSVLRQKCKNTQDVWYISFPASFQAFYIGPITKHLGQKIGLITIKNESKSEDLMLTSFRISEHSVSHQGAQFTLGPLKSKCFQFIKEWVIQVSHLEFSLVDFTDQTSSSYKVDEDLLGMASKF